jgi:hypothetical protein
LIVSAPALWLIYNISCGCTAIIYRRFSIQKAVPYVLQLERTIVSCRRAILNRRGSFHHLFARSTVMSQAWKEIYRRQIRDARNNITRIRIAHATHESIVCGPNVIVRWACDLPPHLKLPLASMTRLQPPPRTIGDLNWRRHRVK